ncbi:MAG: hypothetical protein JW828_04940 [Sedimentisphaerales bacterium]|nr:hypothetical protein [Sedimentisphaerales bacterium]
MRTRMFVAGLLVCTMAVPAGALTATLDPETLLQLDHYSSDLLSARVLHQGPGLGGGVQYDIYFPGNGPLDTQLFYTVRQTFDLSEFTMFSMTFSVVSIDGVDPQTTWDLGMYASPFIRDASGLPHFWEQAYLDLTAGPGTVMQDIPISTLAIGDWKAGDRIQEIGFDVRIESESLPSDGLTLRLLVSPTPNAIAIPAPTPLALLLTGACFVSGRKRHRQSNQRV